MSATSEAITPDRIKLSDQVLEGLDNFDFTIPPDSVLEPVIEYDHHGRRVVDRWRLLLLLGPTGFGSLWHGRSLNSNQSVYIKLLPRASVVYFLSFSFSFHFSFSFFFFFVIFLPHFYLF